MNFVFVLYEQSEQTLQVNSFYYSFFFQKMSDGELFMKPHNYRSRYLVTIDNKQSIVNVCKYEKCKIEEASSVTEHSKRL